MGITDRLRRLVAVLMLLAMGPVPSAAAACGGWSASASERMACCRSAANHCAAVSADDCCADRETRQNLETVTATPVSPGEMSSERVAPAVRPLRSLRVALRPLAERPSAYLLDSVFLI